MICRLIDTENNSYLLPYYAILHIKLLVAVIFLHVYTGGDIIPITRLICKTWGTKSTVLIRYMQTCILKISWS